MKFLRKTSLGRQLGKKKSGRDLNMNKLGIVLIVVILTIGAVGAYFLLRPQPEFQVNNLSLSQNEIAKGDTVTAQVEVSNIGDAKGTHTIELEVGDETLTKDITLDAGESKTVSFDIEKQEKGTYNINIEDLSETFEVVELFEKVYFEGAFEKYKVNAYSPLHGNITGEITNTITDISEDSYTQIIEVSGDISAIWKPETITKDIDEALTKPTAAEKGEFIGTETLNTKIGRIKVEHYRFENQVEGGPENIDVWIEKKTNIRMRLFAESPRGYSMSMEIIETNVDYPKEKAE